MEQQNQFDLTGFIDSHLHAYPEHIPRLLDDISMAEQARAARLAGFVLKNHNTLTADRAYIASRIVPGIRIWGGLVLNESVGGFNPAAVEVALAYGAAEIWLPTLSASNHRTFYGLPGIGLSLKEDEIPQELHDIMEMIAAKDVILGTGHFSPAEIVLAARIARAHGVKKTLVTHPEAPFIDMPISTQLQLAASGCRFERTWVFTTAALGHLMSPDRIMHDIREVGFESTVIATDMGQVGNPPPVEGLIEYCTACKSAGFTNAQIRHMGTNISEWLT